MIFVFLILIAVRIVQSYFIVDISIFNLKWALLGEWLAQGHEMYSEAYDYTGFFSAQFFKLQHLIFGRGDNGRYVLNITLIIIQASLFNQILLKNKAFEESTYVPSLIYVVVVCSIPDFVSTSPVLISLTFILMTLNSVLRRISNQVTDAIFIEAGIYLGISTLFYAPSVVFLLGFFISLLVFSSSVPRRMILYFFSFSLVLVLAFLYHQWKGIGDLYFFNSWIYPFSLVSKEKVSLLDILFWNVVVLVFFLIAIGIVNTRGSFTNFQLKVQQMMWIWFIMAILVLMISRYRNGIEMVYFVPVFAYFLSYYLLLLERRIFRVLIPYLLVFGSISYSLFCYQKQTTTLQVGHVTDTHRGYMVLGVDLQFYKGIEMSSPCFEPYLTTRAFEGLDYYQSAIRIYDLILLANPKGFKDEIGIMDKVFFRFPELEDRYLKVEDTIYKRVSN